MTAREIRAMRRERDRLLVQLQDRGGRGVDLAEDIDALSREIREGEKQRDRWHKARRFIRRAA